MSCLIKFEKLSKIYSSNNSVAVGLRNINLELNLGEFVTVTGSSGSGKTTLLNVLSGMDSYEEGEFFFNGEATSYFSQKDWEEYRLQNISFVFQDYNILDSFTVLENVEFALLHIEDVKLRRKKALELIKKVGLESHIHHKGSKLSGGQKQRTVIARALAKDSPIILADEPTGNLDSHSAKEIVSLLKNISKDKLVVVVTHNEDQFEDVATRKIKLFDGQITSDIEVTNIEKKDYRKIELPSLKNELLTGITLGLKRFKSKPKLSTFIIVMLFLALIGIFSITSSNYTSLSMYEPLFTHYDGRVIVTKLDGTPITDDDMQTLVPNIDYIIDDAYFDANTKIYNSEFGFYSNTNYKNNFNYTGSLDAGRMPNAMDEVIICGPRCDLDMLKYVLNKRVFIKSINSPSQDHANNAYSFLVVGYKTYLDNTKPGYVYFTKKGYEYYAMDNRITNFTYDKSYVYHETIPNYSQTWYTTASVQIDPTLKKGEVSVYYSKKNQDTSGFSKLSLMYGTATTIINVTEVKYYKISNEYAEQLYISTEDAQEIYENIYLCNDKQVSIFYANDKEAKKDINRLLNSGYSAFGSYETAKTTDITAYINKILNVILWIFIVWFFTIFMNICTRRSINSTKNDVAIFRSMGINKKVIKISTYSQMFVCALISLILLILLVFVIFYVPSTNATFKFVKPIGYIYIILSIVIIVTLISYNFNKKLFNESITKNLRRDER